MKKCSQCGWENADTNSLCINCNAEFEQALINADESSQSTERFDRVNVTPIAPPYRTSTNKKMDANNYMYFCWYPYWYCFEFRCA